MFGEQRHHTHVWLAAIPALAITLAGCSTPATEASVSTSATHSHGEGAHTHDAAALPVVEDFSTTVTWDDARVAALQAYADTNENVTITVDGETISITGNGIPDHETGTFPNSGNPNAISAQDVAVTLARTATYVGEPTSIKVFGISLGGVPFDPGTAERDPSTGTPIEAFNSGVFNAGEDFNNAHVQPDGTYHYHGIPTSLADLGGATHGTLVGFAADGFPVYTLFGYDVPGDANSAVRALSSSWQLRDGERAAGEPEGAYNGDYTSDFVFVEGSGDLDECNGLFTVTPDFPEGTYAYFITDDFPYIPRCVMGQITMEGVLTQGGPAGGPSGGDMSERPRPDERPPGAPAP